MRQSVRQLEQQPVRQLVRQLVRQPERQTEQGRRSLQKVEAGKILNTGCPLATHTWL